MWNASEPAGTSSLPHPLAQLWSAPTFLQRADIESISVPVCTNGHSPVTKVLEPNSASTLNSANRADEDSPVAYSSPWYSGVGRRRVDSPSGSLQAVC